MFQKLKRDFIAKNVDLYLDEIRIRNYKSFRDFSVIGLIISIVVLLFGLFLRKIVTFNIEFLILACYFIFMIILSELLKRKRIKYIISIFYTVMTPIMVMAILMGTFLDRQQPTITIMIFMCALPLFILDKPWRVCLYITVVTILYCICCYIAKDFALFIEDIMDLIAFYTLAMGVNFLTLKDRLENVENYIKFREKSEIDVLTGIYNRGIAKLIQENVYGAFCIFDVDDFKYINDNFGHSCGDEVLQEISKVVRKSFSNKDIFFRMGGDEFIIYCVDCIEDIQYKKRIEELYEGIRSIKLSSINSKPINISLGCCVFNQGKTDYNELYKWSDKALYESKSNGKGIYTIRFLNQYKYKF